jgi:hypothetical protein
MVQRLNPNTMKTTITSLILVVTLASVKGLSAQTTYNINNNTTYSAAGIPANCKNCTINIASGITLTIDKNINVQNVAFNGGAAKSNISLNDKSIVFSATGSFTNINAAFEKSDLTNSGALTITNSAFTFSKTAVVTANASVSLVSSSWKFEENTGLEVAAGVFSINNGSLTIGDGTASSKAYALFNGGALSLLDAVSFVNVATIKNAYENTNPYNGNGTQISTASAVNGPASITAAGVSSSAMLPVKLQSFAAKTNGTTVVLNWITAQEMNSEVFEIERSNDGINWTKIGSVAAKGNSTVASGYSYSEVVKAGGSFSYRLKMIDIDSKSEYSPIVKISFNNTNSAGVKTYPNPATDFFAVDGATGTTQVMVVNMNGAVVKVINGYVANTKVSLNGVIAGNYVVKVSSANGASQSFKMIVAR